MYNTKSPLGSAYRTISTNYKISIGTYQSQSQNLTYIVADIPTNDAWNCFYCTGTNRSDICDYCGNAKKIL